MSAEPRNDFAAFRVHLTRWLGTSSLFPEKELHVDLILNPHAGAFRHRGRCRRLVEGLRAAEARFPPGPAREVRVSTFVTEYPGHEKAILSHLHAADPLGPGGLRLVVTAGGDGTSRGALISALDLGPEHRRSLLFFRLPLGTGNDAAETRDWAEALEILSGRGRATAAPAPLPVIEVRVPGQPVHYSFNIASVGIDAFVAHLTNRLKSWFPGDSYGLMVDVAAFFYEAFVRVVPTRLVLTQDGEPRVDKTDRFLLAALGSTGRRTYGAGKRVLPDDDNFCLATQLNLFTKLACRKPFYEGTHRSLSCITLASGNRLTVESPVRLPLQMDGEVLWLDPRDFPLTMEVSDRGLQALRPSSRL